MPTIHLFLIAIYIVCDISWHEIKLGMISLSLSWSMTRENACPDYSAESTRSRSQFLHVRAHLIMTWRELPQDSLGKKWGIFFNITCDNLSRSPYLHIYSVRARMCIHIYTVGFIDSKPPTSAIEFKGTIIDHWIYGWESKTELSYIYMCVCVRRPLTEPASDFQKFAKNLVSNSISLDD